MRSEEANRAKRLDVKHHQTLQQSDLATFSETLGSVVREALVVLSEDLHIISANAQFGQFLSTSPSTVKGCAFYDLAHGQFDVPDFHNLFRRLLRHDDEVTGLRVAYSQGATTCTCLVNARIRRHRNHPSLIVLTLEKIAEPVEDPIEDWDHHSLISTLIEDAPVALAMFDRHMRYLAASRRWITDHRLNPAELYGRFHYDIFPEIDESWRQAYRRGLAGESVRKEEDEFVQRDGSVHWLRWEVKPWHQANGDVGGIVIFTEDITELKRMSTELEIEANGLARLNEVSSVLWRTRDLEDGLQEMLQATMEMMSADFGNIQLLAEDGRVLTIAAQQGFSQEFLDAFREVSVADGCACGRALRAQQRLLIEDVEDDEEYSRYLEIARRSGYRAVQSTPLVNSQGETLGIISTYWRSPHRPTRQELARLDLFARQAAQFISRHQMDQKLHAQEAYVESILNTAGDAIISVAGQNQIVRVNAATEEMFGYARSDLLGKNIRTLIPGLTSCAGSLEQAQSVPAAPDTHVGAIDFIGKKKGEVSFHLELSVSQVDHLGLYTLIIRDITDRYKLEREVLTGVEDEQRRIGAELHDSAQQELTAIGLLARVLLDILQRGYPVISDETQSKCQDITKKLISGIKRANQEIREIAHGLFPVQISPEGLEKALRDLSIQTQAAGSIRCNFECSGHIVVADEFTATHVYRIAQEAVVNAIKHAHAKQISIELKGEATLLVLKVTDDGTGIKQHDDTKGVGIKSMEYRAHLINGILSIANLDTGGTQVTCTLFTESNSNSEQ